MSDAQAPTRVTLIQPSLAKYRLPVYQNLAGRPGLDLTVIYGEDPGVPNVEPIGLNAHLEPHRPVGVGKRRPFVWQPAQLKYASKAHADVLIMPWNTRWLSLPPALRKARKAGVRTVVWGHGYSKNESPRRAWLRRKVATMADGVLFYSRAVAQQYVDQGFDADRVFVAANCLDQTPIQTARDAWTNDPARLDAFVQEHRLQDADPILFVSRLDPANRLDLLLQALQHLQRTHPTARLHVIGKGEPEGARLRGLADQLGVADRVAWLGAIYDEDALAPWFLTARAFCYPGNIGLSLHHAMGYGLPVVTADEIAAHNPEIEALIDGKNGRLYRPDDPQDLAAALGGLIDDSAGRARMQDAAHRTATQQYTLARMADGFVAAIQGRSNLTDASPDSPATV